MKVLAFLFIITAILTVPAAWLTHVWVTLLAGKWGFLIAGAILPPIGIIHGIMLWLGVA